MSLQWTLIATFLYFEVAIVLLLVLPIASPRRWQRLFNSRLFHFIGAQASMYFFILLAILVLFLLDAIREMRKYSSVELTDHTHQHLDAEMQGNMRLFRAQRNFYISGFALFLSLVIRRLVILISAQATLLAQSEANLRQAQSATNAARSLMAQKDDTSKTDKEQTEEQDSKIAALKSKVSLLEDELTKEKKDKEALKSQADNLGKEYDRMTEEFSKLQKKITISGDSKKDE